jgi:heme-degrading monooxygenase HmoA
MILEIASLQIRFGLAHEFEAAFRTAQNIIASMPGYIGHELQKCIEQDHHYMLLVRWESVEHHEVGFRQSVAYQEWRKLLHHFYDPFPTVLHYACIAQPAFAR